MEFTASRGFYGAMDPEDRYALVLRGGNAEDQATRLATTEERTLGLLNLQG
jgi:hypothetical protein